MFEFIARLFGKLFTRAGSGGGWDDDAGATRFAPQDEWTHAASTPAFNVDGTPMLGALDAKGNPYGVTDGGLDIGGSPWDDGPSHNIDGTPMFGMFDANGHVFGEPDTSASWSGMDTGGSWCSGSDAWSSSDSFGAF